MGARPSDSRHTFEPHASSMHVAEAGQRPLPLLLTIADVAALLRTSRAAIYTMIARGHLPGVLRLRRRVLVRTDDLLHWLGQKSTPSPERIRR